MINFFKIVGILSVIVIAVILGQKIIIKGPSKDKDVVDFIKRINETCPSMINPETRLDKVITTSDKNLQFNYTLIHQVKDSLPIENLKKFMEPVSIDKIKNSGTLRKFLDKDLTWIYSYSDKRGIHIQGHIYA